MLFLIISLLLMYLPDLLLQPQFLLSDLSYLLFHPLLLLDLLECLLQLLLYLLPLHPQPQTLLGQVMIHLPVLGLSLHSRPGKVKVVLQGLQFLVLKAQLMLQFIFLLGEVNVFLFKGQNPRVKVRLVADRKDVVALSEAFNLLLEHADLFFEVKIFLLFLYFF